MSKSTMTFINESPELCRSVCIWYALFLFVFCGCLTMHSQRFLRDLLIQDNDPLTTMKRQPNLNSSMITAFVTASPGETAADVLNKIRRNHFEYHNQVFVMDAGKHPVGYVDLISLLKLPPSARIDEVISPCYPISNTVSLEHAANHAISKKINSVPIVNEEGCLIGLLPERAIIETLRKEHIEDIHKIAGIRREVTNASVAITEPPSRSLWHRLPWLLVGLAGSILATFIMSRFEHILDNNITLAFFIPGIVYLADAIGTQTETIVIRGLSLTWSTFKPMVKKEFLTGALIGLIFGVLSLAVMVLSGLDVRVAATVGISILAAGVFATTTGLFLPYFLQRSGIDPAFGSGPLATVIQDILSVSIYLMIAQALLSFPQ